MIHRVKQLAQPLGRGSGSARDHKRVCYSRINTIYGRKLSGPRLREASEGSPSDVAMSSEVAELCEFLEHERADVRQMAAEGVKTYTGSGDGLTLLLQVEGLLCRLVSMLGDVSSAATAAAVGAALVNISQEPAARAKLLNLSCVDAATPSAAAAAASLQSTSQSTPQPAAVTSASGSKATGASEARSESKRAEEELLEMCLLLLANLTQFDRGCAQLLGETSRPHLCRLLASFAAAPAHTAYFDSFPLVLTHVCAASDGRAMLLLEHPSALRLLSKLALTADSKPLHAVAQSLRNLCFEAAETAPNASALRELADGIIVSLTVRLTPPDAELDDEEIAMLSPMMREALEVFARNRLAPTSIPASISTPTNTPTTAPPTPHL